MKTTEQKLDDLIDIEREAENLKDKEELISEIMSICNANKDNDYCCTYQLKSMIDDAFKLWGYTS